MPELPDVEVFKRYFDSTALHKKVDQVTILDDQILEKISARSFQIRLKNKTFKSTSRYGKYLFVLLDSEEFLLMHFGMTGYLNYYKNDEDQPEYAKVVFKLTNGFHLAYACIRKFGEITLIDDKDEFIQAKALGPDAYNDIKQEDFIALMKNRHGSIKAALMNQKILAGIGNVYSDEILFQAKIHPLTEIGSLDEKDLKEIYTKMKQVLEKAIAANVEMDKFPKNFLINNRKNETKCPICGGTITSEKFMGRTTYYCKKHQKLHEYSSYSVN